MRKLLNYIGEYKKYMLLTPLLMVGEVIMEIFIPFLMSKIINVGIIEGAGYKYIIYNGAILCLISLTSLYFGYTGGKYAARASVGLSKNIRKALYNKIQDFSFSNVDKFSTSSLITRITTDVNNVQNATMMTIRIAFRAPLMMIGATTMALIVSPQLSMVFLFSIPILATLLAIIHILIQPKYLKILKKLDQTNLKVQENLIGIRVVKSFAKEEHEIEEFEEITKTTLAISKSVDRLASLGHPIVQVIISLSFVFVLWFGGKMAINHTIEIGTITSFVIYVAQISMSIVMLVWVIINLVISASSAKRINEVLDENIDLFDNEIDANFKDGSIEFRDVNFSYNNDKANLVLKNINLKINSGEMIGIIGSTGSGKSSLVQLLPRLYDVLNGEVIVGKNNVKNYKFQTLRDEIAIVLQKNVLFTGSIVENLRWGNEKATKNEIKKVCIQAQADDFISSFETNYNTMLTHGASNLSGGQKQRLCIARALLKNPKILILDDSTSAVDTATDAKIRKVFREEFKNTTKIIIAQRTLSIKDADKIIVMDDGEIKGIGTHQELLGNNEIYKEIYYSQNQKEDL
ncbi:MAG: ABC transporter ATP-binding protein/permease [Rickettsiales bacterium]|jgi:ATP-binding cassette subfamily B protein|nr:ABC transporter ATP-binding protein/permease [Rickettsiales bacterium]